MEAVVYHKAWYWSHFVYIGKMIVFPWKKHCWPTLGCWSDLAAKQLNSTFFYTYDEIADNTEKMAWFGWIFRRIWRVAGHTVLGLTLSWEMYWLAGLL